MTSAATKGVEPAASDRAIDAAETDGVNRGAVFTRRWVADLVLDLAGYTPDLPLADHVAIEPACGPGAFVAAMAERLVESCRRRGTDIATAAKAIVAVDIDPNAVVASRRLVEHALTQLGVDAGTAKRLAQSWVREGDFLRVADSLPQATWVIGNPPYVRLEDVDPDDMEVYRARWNTMTGRADLYVGFIEASLGLLAPEGKLSFICADRWMRNQYGAKLRTLVEESYALDTCVVLHEVDAFEDRVAAYPAIVVLRAGEQGQALVCEANGQFDAAAAKRLARAWGEGPRPVRSDIAYSQSWMPDWFRSVGSWPSATPEHLVLLSELEARFPTLTDAGVDIAVGVATGADDVYLVTSPAKTEPERLLKIISAREVSSGRIEWKGRYLVNPWDADGLVDLKRAPGMAAYLRAHKRRVTQRDVAERHPRQWWRTIDRVDPSVAGKQKLLIPDLKERIFPVLDEGVYYPAHSLYYLTSTTWDLEALGGLLMSDIANLFVSAYSVRMANGYMRVSAQYLRRVRIPSSADVPEELKAQLRAAFCARDWVMASQVALRVYEIAPGGPDPDSGVD